MTVSSIGIVEPFVRTLSCPGLFDHRPVNALAFRLKSAHHPLMVDGFCADGYRESA